jgi:hypothetical protein
VNDTLDVGIGPTAADISTTNSPAQSMFSFARLRLCKGDRDIDHWGEFVRIHYRQGHFRTTRYTLLHKMVHVKLHPYGGHGPAFDAEMLRLATEGAFRRLW